MRDPRPRPFATGGACRAWSVILVVALLGFPGSCLGASRALIVVGLPGDKAHAAQFGAVARQWRDWLTGSLGFDPAEVLVLGALEGAPATRAAIGRAAAAMKATARPDDRIWVFWLGHANLDGEHAFLHLPGPDLRDDQFGTLFEGLAGREQVFWMTSTCSGWLLRGLAAPGRVVVAATERDRETTETEFPGALGRAAGMSIDQLDTNRDGKVAVLELYRATVAEVASRFAAEQRVATEHARIDDRGDGVGAESPDDGPAARIYLPYGRDRESRQ